MESILSDLHIRIVRARRTILPAKFWDRPQECDPFARFYVVNKGIATTTVAGKLKTFKQGYLYIIPSHTVFQHADSPGFDHYWLHFQAILPSGLSIFEILDSEWQVPESVIPDARKIAQQIVNLYNSNNFLDIIESRNLLTKIFCQFLRHIEINWKTPQKDLERFENILRYIEDHIAEPITVEDLAGKCHLQVQHFSEVFRNCFGLPPIRFVNQKRIEQAQFYLANSSIPIKKIGIKLGYIDECYFSRVFKRITGISPRQFRQKEIKSVSKTNE